MIATLTWTRSVDHPTDLATGPDGNVYAVDFGNDRVHVFRCRTCQPR